MTGNQDSINNTNVESEESRAVNNTGEINDGEERDNEAWTNSSTKHLRGRVGRAVETNHEP